MQSSYYGGCALGIGAALKYARAQTFRSCKNVILISNYTKIKKKRESTLTGMFSDNISLMNRRWIEKKILLLPQVLSSAGKRNSHIKEECKTRNSHGKHTAEHRSAQTRARMSTMPKDPFGSVNDAMRYAVCAVFLFFLTRVWMQVTTFVVIAFTVLWRWSKNAQCAGGNYLWTLKIIQWMLSWETSFIR